MLATMTSAPGNDQIVPARYRPRAAEVEALGYDGSSRSAESVKRWFSRRTLHTSGIVIVDEYALHLREPGTDLAVIVRPGDVVIFDRAARTWETLPADDFGERYTRQPRELPIFDDGERVE